ncbi:transglycosylase domain-containing protein [Aquihabitans sp. G128]|uniref:transglycosylase domain-containing protein n=1 Tax=Aquihabitans sp. G128 TaxID=2849779 RepID=UPI001C21FF22|nr:transglycosylase domain-containing protein [Aquihabitans sp. G128]QXC59849.1 transglycosylase domain-containing protein [Aquihabitans sp. G128]
MRTRKPVPVHNLKVNRRGKVKKRSVLWRMRRAFYLAALALTVGAAGLVYVLGQIELPVDPKVAKPQDQTSFICASEVQVNCNDSNAMAQLHGTEDRVLVTYEQIPDILREAVVSAEDRDFFQHGGVDPMGIARAAISDLRGNGVRQGGSTITQQYVKQEYLTSEQTATRKIKEAVMAVKLEQQISKQEILTRYLNTVYFGRGAYGVQAASRAWFKHDIGGLNAGEAAFLAGLLRNPNGADPYRGPNSLKEAERRRRVVLQAMTEEGYVTKKEQKLYLAVPMDPNDAAVQPADRFIKPPPVASTLGEEVKGSQYGSEYFAEYVRQWLVKEFGSDDVYGGGLKVYTTLDLNMQKAAYDAVTTTLNRPGDPAASIVAVDDQGQVKAMMGGTDFKNSKVNLATGKAGGGSGRQPGSTFKMFALAEAVREGYSVESVLPSPPKIEITDPTCLNGEDKWSVRGGPGGASSLVTATKNSINTVYAQLMLRLGPQKVLQMAHDMGVTADLKPYCSLVLGGGEVSVLDMAAGYSTLANNGVSKSPIVVTRVEFPDGRVVRYAPDTKEVLTPDQAGRVTYALQQVVAGGTGADANFGHAAAGKTGTTQSNVDGWFVGYTPKLTAAVWMGYPNESKPMNDVHGIKVQGGTFPARMWKTFMETVTANTDTGVFPDVADLSVGAVLDPAQGKTSVVAGGSSYNGTTTSTVPRSTVPRSTVPQTTTPRSTVPQTTTPRSTVPQTTAPATTTPATTTPGGTGTGAGTNGEDAAGAPPD